MNKYQPKAPSIILVLSLLAAVVFTLSLSLFKGSTSVPLYQLLFDKNTFRPLFLHLRLPHTLNAFMAGGLLAVSGCLLQLLLANPLADPYALGISGGSAIVTLLFMLLGLPAATWIAGAWAGSLLTIALIVLLSLKHQFQTHALLLIGIALSCGFSALITLILLTSDHTTLPSLLFWLSGDINQTGLPYLPGCILLFGIISCYYLAPGMNLLTLGEKEAQALGLPSKKYRFLLLLLSSLMTAAAVTLAGCIGFVGMIVPHMSRKLFGSDHRILLPCSLLLGGSLVTFAETLARSFIPSQPLPVGMMLAMIGVPTFLWLLRS
jgi:iron complex transport system permease protein